jgi:Lon protease-like protein
MPLRVFEPRYLEMLADIAGSGAFVIALIRTGPEVGGEALPYPIGTLVDLDGVQGDSPVKRIEPLGRDRVFLDQVIREGKPYLRAECSAYIDEDWTAGTEEKVKELEAALLQAAIKHAPGTEDGVTAAFDKARQSLDDENFSLFLCGCLALPLPYRQRLLQSQKPMDRMNQVLHLLQKAEESQPDAAP